MRVQGHEQGIALFEDCAANRTSGALKTYASETLPTLREHYEDITALRNAAGMTE